MQIKIEIDVRPEELRRFLGLPDVAGLQEDLIHFLRNKVEQVNENFDAGAFVKGNLKLIGRNPAVRKLLAAARKTTGGDAAAVPEAQVVAEAMAAAAAEAAQKSPARKPRKRSTTARKRAAKKTAAKATDNAADVD